MPTALARLVRLLAVEELEVDLYRGANTDAGWIRVYGGQVVAQALAAAQKTVDPGRHVHSLHSYFIRPGDPKAPILYRVERVRDGSSFTTRRVAAIQHGVPIFLADASFQLPEEGLSHQLPMPHAPAPARLPSEAELHERAKHRIPEPFRTLWSSRDRPFEFRPVAPGNPFRPEPRRAHAQTWFRADDRALPAPLAAGPALSAALLAYASDMTLLDTCILPHGVSWTDPKLQAASLDHNLWFHQPYDPLAWHLYEQTSPVSSGGRGLNIGHVFREDGLLVASVVQEGLIRYRG